MQAIEKECAHLRQIMQAGFADIKADIELLRQETRRINGTVRAHDKALVEQAGHIEAHCKALVKLDAWREGLLATAFRWAIAGAGAIVTLVAILLGAARLAGLW